MNIYFFLFFLLRVNWVNNIARKRAHTHALSFSHSFDHDFHVDCCDDMAVLANSFITANNPKIATAAAQNEKEIINENTKYGQVSHSPCIFLEVHDVVVCNDNFSAEKNEWMPWNHTICPTQFNQMKKFSIQMRCGAASGENRDNCADDDHSFSFSFDFLQTTQNCN